MVLCDSNIWLALTLSGHVHHTPVRLWFESQTRPASLAFCRATQQSYLRLLTNTAVLRAHSTLPLTNEQAWEAYEALLSDYRVTLIANEPPGLEHRWRSFTLRDTPSPKLWMDAYLAAFALLYGFQFVTTDQAFKQFNDLDLLILGANP